MMRWLLLPGGDRTAGLRLMTDARDRGRIMRAEADFQLHLIYLWYEKRVGDGLDLHRDLQARYPRNPLFYQTETDILDAYFHDDAGAVAVLESLITSADAHRVNAPAVASRRARTLLAAIRSRVRR